MGMDYAHAVRYLFEKSGMSQAELVRGMRSCARFAAIWDALGTQGASGR